MESPLLTIDIILSKFDKIKQLVGYFKLNYSDDDGLSVIGIYLPCGLCYCLKYNRDNDDMEYIDLEWNELSGYNKLNILHEISDSYC